MLKLLGRSTSINVRKVLWTGAELGLVFDHEESAGDDLYTPAFLALNPNAKIPVLIDGDLVLSESNAICRYLAMRERRDDLLPPFGPERARVEQWMDWLAIDLTFTYNYAFRALVRKEPGLDDPRAVARSVDGWNRLMHILDDRLRETGLYVAGPRFTLADVVLGLASQRWTMTPIERPSLPAVEAWMARLAEREPCRLYCTNGMP